LRALSTEYDNIASGTEGTGQTAGGGMPRSFRTAGNISASCTKKAAANLFFLPQTKNRYLQQPRQNAKAIFPTPGCS